MSTGRPLTLPRLKLLKRGHRDQAGTDPEVVLQATWGWYWAADVIAEAGGRVHLAHPLGIKGFGNRRVKNDLKDAEMLADLLRMGQLPESWIPPASIRELRELVRYRHKLSQLRTGLKGQVHAVLGKEGVIPHLTEMWGPAGHAFLDPTQMGDAYEYRLESLRDLIAVYDTEIRRLDQHIHRQLRDDVGYRTIQQLNGVGPVHAAAFTAEIGDVSRFSHPKQTLRVGRADPAAAGIGHQDPPRINYQTGLPPGALVGDRSRLPLPRWRPDPRHSPVP